MTATIAQARDELMAAFLVPWNASSLTSAIAVVYDDKDSDDEMDASKPWVRVTLKHDPGSFGQKTLSDSAGKRRFSRAGFLTIQVFTPINDGLDLSDAICQMLLDTFDGKDIPRGIWARDVGLQEIGISNSWHQSNVTLNFNYDQIK